MLTSLSLALAAALFLPACTQDASKTPAGQMKLKPAAAQEATKPETKPEPKPEAAPEATPEAATTPEAAPAAAAATSEESESMPGSKILLDPKHEKLNQKAPDTFKAKVETNEGSFVIEVTRAWAPNGADRFYNLVANGYYDGVRFFRVIDGFMAQFGIHGDPQVSAAWRGARIKDDKVTQSNKRGFVTFAMAGPNTRTTQLFINFADKNSFLDTQGFPPFGQVIEGMDVVDKLYKGYGEGAPSGKGPDQGRVQMEGNAYLEKSFPELDYIVTATIAK